MDGMSAFGLEAKEATMFADVLAKTASSTNTDISGLGEAFKYSAAAANAAGMEVQQAAGFLGMLANAGIKGSSGGTVLNAVLRDMKKNAEGGALAIGKTKVAIYDAKGNMRDFSDILGDVEKATEGMTQAQRDSALSANFGDEAMRGINIAMAEGVGTLKDLEGELYNSAGAAQEMADVMADNLGGDIDSLSSAWEGFKIALFDGGLGQAFRPIIQGLTKSIQWVTKASEKFLEFGSDNDGLISKVKGIWEAFTGWFDAIMAEIEPILNRFNEIANEAFEMFKEIIMTVWGIVQPIFAALWGIISSVGATILEVFQLIAIPIIERFWSVVQLAWAILQPILTLLGGAFEILGSVVKFLWDAVLSPFVSFLAGAFASAIELGTPLVDGFTGAFEWLGNKVDWVTGQFKKFADWVNGFKPPEWLTSMGGKVVGFFGGGADGSHATGAYDIPFDGYCIAA